MYVLIIGFLFSLVIQIGSMSIPSIRNVSLYSISNINFTIRINKTCQECLCELFNPIDNISYVALNCFINETCQFFPRFPLSYTLRPSTDVQLYFLQNIFPNVSQCCMPNITELLDRLENTIPTILNLTFSPAAFGYDQSKPNETAVIGSSNGSLYWFNPMNMTFIRSSSINTSLTIALQDNLLYTGYDMVPMIDIYDSQTNSLLSTINYSSLNKIRKIIFMNNSQSMIVSTQTNNSLTVFNIQSSTNYTIQQEIPFPLVTAHGLAKVNDTFFYASTWSNGSIVSYNYENSTWTSTRFFNATSTASGSHIAVDECERIWFINTAFGLHIFDSSGMEIAKWNMSLGSTSIYDLLFLPNYILLISHESSKQIFRYDPQILCT